MADEFVKVRPLFLMADTADSKDLRELVKSYWTNCVLISALLNSALVGIAFSPPDFAIEETALGRGFAVCVNLGVLMTTFACFITWVAWCAMDLVPVNMTGDMLKKNSWMILGIGSSTVLGIVCTLMALALNAWSIFEPAVALSITGCLLLLLAIGLGLQVKAQMHAKAYWKA